MPRAKMKVTPDVMVELLNMPRGACIVGCLWEAGSDIHINYQPDGSGSVVIAGMHVSTGDLAKALHMPRGVAVVGCEWESGMVSVTLEGERVPEAEELLSTYSGKPGSVPFDGFKVVE